jgi:hypothetical protein
MGEMMGPYKFLAAAWVILTALKVTGYVDTWAIPLIPPLLMVGVWLQRKQDEIEDQCRRKEFMESLPDGAPIKGEVWFHKGGFGYYIKDVGFYLIERPPSGWFEGDLPEKHLCVCFSHIDGSREIHIQDLPQFMKNFTRAEG